MLKKILQLTAEFQSILNVEKIGILHVIYHGMVLNYQNDQCCYYNYYYKNYWAFLCHFYCI